jgi:XRE family aerobic/anaerobic benzoate catabolism transcriptional regulator
MLQRGPSGKRNNADSAVPEPVAASIGPPDLPLEPKVPAPGRQDAADRAYLHQLGERVRELRARRGMSRKILARDSGVSERYLAQLEAGQGNISIVLLRQLARALGSPVEAMVAELSEAPQELTRSVELLRRLSVSDLDVAYRLLASQFAESDFDLRRRRIALIGLRGAGKSTLGAMLAQRLGSPFVELDREIEREAGMPLSTLFDLYGQPAFRRLERRRLDHLVDQHQAIVIATGGGLVSEAATFERLLSSCFTIWVRASPTAHMERVIPGRHEADGSQSRGDDRPSAHPEGQRAPVQTRGRRGRHHRPVAGLRAGGNPRSAARRSSLRRGDICTIMLARPMALAVCPVA